MGRIRIGEEELFFKEWLSKLRDVRWTEAWSDYWLSQGALRDITYSFTTKNRRDGLRAKSHTNLQRMSISPR
jgi:hypothetical protein